MTSLWARRGGWLVIACAVLAACGIAAAMALDPTRDDSSGHRDEAQFLSHVKEFFGGAAHPEPEGVPDNVYIAEGDSACQWLATQPIVSGPAPDQGAYELYSRFLREVEPVDEWPFGSGRGVRGSVVYDAWHYLCPGVEETRIWRPPPGSD